MKPKSTRQRASQGARKSVTRDTDALLFSSGDEATLASDSKGVDNSFEQVEASFETSGASEGLTSPIAYRISGVSEELTSPIAYSSAPSSPEGRISGFRGKSTPNTVTEHLRKKVQGKLIIVRTVEEKGGVKNHYCFGIIEGAYGFKASFESGILTYRDSVTNELIEFSTVDNFGVIHFETAKKRLVETFATHNELLIFPDELKQSPEFLNHAYYSYDYTDYARSDYIVKGEALFRFIQNFW